MTGDKDFALLVGRAFLREVERGDKQSAIAFGRAFLLSLGMKGPAEIVKHGVANGRPYDGDLVVAEN
jgi:hypothetical protein